MAAPMEVDPKPPEEPTTRGGFELPWVGATVGQAVLARCGCYHCDYATQLEKYRPQYIREIVGNTEAVARLQVIAEEGNMPNIILAVRSPSRKAFKAKCCVARVW
jgi:replication factor C subunit 2/4